MGALRTFLIILAGMLMVLPAALAPSHPIFIDPETGQAIDEILGDPGTTPDSFWYGFERWWETIQVSNANTPGEKAALLQSLIRERYAEFNAMIEDRNYEVAEFTIGEIEEIGNDLVEVVEGIEATGENLDFVLEVEGDALAQEDLRELLEQNMENLAAVGEISAEQAESLARALEEEITAVQAAVEEQEEEITRAIAEEQGITNLEAELLVADAEEEAGLAPLHQEEVGEGLEDAAQELEQVEQDLVQAIEEGREVPPEAAELLAQAHAELDQSQGYFIDEQFGRSFEHLIAVNAIIADAYGFISGEVSGENLILSLEDRQQRVIEENTLYISEYEQHREEWVAQFPGYEFDRWYEQSQNTLGLAAALEGALAEKTAELEAKGFSDGQIFDALGDIFSTEYERIYGDTYVPPVFLLEPIPIEVMGTQGVTDLASLPPDALETDGGFVEGYTYTDPVTGYTYQFTEDGYTYTTLLGVVHEEQYPEGFTPPTAYEVGDEEHSYTVETPEGTVTYNYYATGYDVTLPDGTVESHAYPPGGYDIAGGGLFDHDATGFDFRHEGEVTRYDYSPVYDVFISDDGTYYNPDTHFYGGRVEFDSEENNYQYEDEGGETWSYDPASNSWTAADGRTYAGGNLAIAPIGHEGEGVYETELGEVWSWNPNTQTWSNQGGDSFNPSTNEWESGMGTTYTFEDGRFYDPETGEVVSDVVWSGVTWVYDHDSDSWTHTIDESVYAPDDGPGSMAYSGPDPGWVYDAQIAQWTAPGWTYDSTTRTWTSLEEGTFVDLDGDPTGYFKEGTFFKTLPGVPGISTYDPATGTYTGGYSGSKEGLDAFGNYVGGEWGIGGYYAEGGEGYQAPADGGYTSGDGSYSGDGSVGDSGGSYGGDGGSGMGGGDAGGGGDGGGTGYGVREIKPARKLHPITRFLMRYLGLEK